MLETSTQETAFERAPGLPTHIVFHSVFPYTCLSSPGTVIVRAPLRHTHTPLTRAWNTVTFFNLRGASVR